MTTSVIERLRSTSLNGCLRFKNILLFYVVPVFCSLTLEKKNSLWGKISHSGHPCSNHRQYHFTTKVKPLQIISCIPLLSSTSQSMPSASWSVSKLVSIIDLMKQWSDVTLVRYSDVSWVQCSDVSLGRRFDVTCHWPDVPTCHWSDVPTYH